MHIFVFFNGGDIFGRNVQNNIRFAGQQFSQTGGSFRNWAENERIDCGTAVPIFIIRFQYDALVGGEFCQFVWAGSNRMLAEFFSTGFFGILRRQDQQAKNFGGNKRIGLGGDQLNCVIIHNYRFLQSLEGRAVIGLIRIQHSINCIFHRFCVEIFAILELYAFAQLEFPSGIIHCGPFRGQRGQNFFHILGLLGQPFKNIEGNVAACRSTGFLRIQCRGIGTLHNNHLADILCGGCGLSFTGGGTASAQ